jgi:hypothetical protein
VRRTKLYEELTQELKGIKNELIENCKEQLKLLEPEYKKLNLNGPLQNNEFLVFARYHYYKDQEERINDPDKYWKKQEKQCREILILLVRYHVKYHNVIGDENAEYLKKYGKCKKSFEEFLMANNEDGKLLEYLAINEHDVEQIISYTVSYTLEETENIKTKSNQIIINENYSHQLMEYLKERFDELIEQGHKTDEKADTIIKSLEELQTAQTSGAQEPEYITHLKNGYLDQYGWVIKSLPKTVIEYVKFTNKDINDPEKRTWPTWEFIQKTFKNGRKNGIDYSKKRCMDALTAAGDQF